MKKEFEPNNNIEIEIKLPAPFPAEEMRTINCAVNWGLDSVILKITL